MGATLSGRLPRAPPDVAGGGTMRWINALRLRLRSFFRAGQVDRELDEELRYHLDRLIDESLSSGMSPEEARRAALRAMGGLEQRRQECRDARGTRWLDDLAWDFRFAVRTFLKSPLFATVAVSSLGLGIGINTAIFGALDALLLRPLPYPHAERLVWIEQGEFHGGAGLPAVEFVDWNEHSRLLESVAAFDGEGMTLTGEGEPERLQGLHVSEGFFPTLGAPMLLGRNFLPAEERKGGDRVVILGHSLWRRRFGSDPLVVGRTIRINGEGLRVVGVLPESFRFFLSNDLWVPLAIDDQEVRTPRQWLFDGVFGRLRERVRPEQAAVELETIRDAYERNILWDANGQDGPSHVRIVPLRDYLVGRGTRRLLAILLGAVGLVLLIACANVANLALARAVVRQKEATIRTALGAGRLRLVRQMLAESVLLGLCGGACGLAVAGGVTQVLVAISPPGTFGHVAEVATIALDGRVLGFTLALSLLSGVLFGLAPALQFSRHDLMASLKDGGRGRLPQGHGTRQALLVAEVALAAVLLIGAGLLIRSFANLIHVDPGYYSENLLTLRVEPYEDASRSIQFEQELLTRVEALPGVERVGAANHLPLCDFDLIVTPWDKGPGGEPALPAPLGIVSRDYFRTLGIRLLAGRFFEERDTADAPRVLILSAAEARALFRGQDPLGKHVNLPEGDPPLFISRSSQGPPTVIGVVDDVKHLGLDREPKPALYVHFRQVAPGRTMLAVRSRLAAGPLTAAIRTQVLAIDPALSIYDVMTMGERLDDSVAARRFTALLLAGFAVLALLLASIGVYGVIAYLVTERTHEMGIRLALGARGADVVRLFMKQGITLVASGLAIGVFAALALTSVMRSLLFDVAPTDPLTFLVVATLLTTVALAACWLPARRAVTIDPLTALRDE
jgi:putative ABC transport system permease protein